MDLTLAPNINGPADLTFAASSDLFNNVYLSLEIEQGSWWFDRSFGLKKRRRLKNTPATAVLLQQDCRDALQWLLTSRRAIKIEVTPVAIPELRHRLRMQCVVTAADGQALTYDKYIEVV